MMQLQQRGRRLQNGVQMPVGNKDGRCLAHKLQALLGAAYRALCLVELAGKFHDEDLFSTPTMHAAQHPDVWHAILMRVAAHDYLDLLSVGQVSRALREY